VPGAPVFRSFFIGGFECSTHRRADGRRLDMVAATAHDVHALADYRRLREYGIATARDGLRWHLIERTPYRYDFSSVLPQIRAAHDLGIQGVWDLCHYGWPDGLDVFSPAFVRRFAGLARAFARLLRRESDAPLFFAPINEISFFAWAGGDMGDINPGCTERADELKSQLVRAAIAGIEAIWDVDRTARICHVDPTFHVIPDPGRPEDAVAAEAFVELQFQAWDMLAGRQRPELGGQPAYLDIIGVNYYPWNQWIYVTPLEAGPTVQRGHPRYRPFRELLTDVYRRYGRPVFVAETGTEGDARPDWLRYVGDETRAALQAGVPVEGICLYPIVNFPGWDDERHCHNGLWDYPDEQGGRAVYEPLARELLRQQALFAAYENEAHRHRAVRTADTEAS
jgi:hypothetical protein